MIKKYRKKPIEIEALQWMGYNIEELREFGGPFLVDEMDGNDLYIPTLEGTLFATVGDFIIKGVKGEFYPCRPEIFASTYEEVE